MVGERDREYRRRRSRSEPVLPPSRVRYIYTIDVGSHFGIVHLLYEGHCQ